jgi:hypothetical protein
MILKLNISILFLITLMFNIQAAVTSHNPTAYMGCPDTTRKITG